MTPPTAPPDAPGGGPDPRRVAGWLAPWLTVGALGAWTAWPGPVPLALAALGIASAVWVEPPRNRSWAIGVVLSVAGIVAGFGALRQSAVIVNDWDGYWSTRQDAVGELLRTELERRLEAGEAAADALATLVEDAGRPVDVTEVEALRRRHGNSGLALYDPEGRLEVWAGTHRGRVPEEVQRGLQRYVYRDLPLFGYLYVSAVSGEGSVAVAAFLLRTDLPSHLDAELGDFASGFRQAVGERIRVVPDAPRGADGVWDLDLRNRRLLSVVLEPPDPVERADRELLRWRVVVAVIAVIAWLLFAASGPPHLGTGVPAAATLLVLAGTLPLQRVEALAPLFDSRLFALPGPVMVSLGRLALLVLTAVMVVSVLPQPRIRLRPWGAGLATALLFPVVLSWIDAGLSPTAMASSELAWILHQATVGTLLTLVAGSALIFTRGGRAGGVRLGVALALAVLLAVGSAAWIAVTGGDRAWWWLAWGLPVGVGAAAIDHWSGWRRSIIAWAVAGVVAATAAIPAAWSDHLEARMAIGAETLRRLADPVDVGLEARLRRVATAADSAAGSGQDGVELLYAAWRASGLAETAQPVRLTLWSPGGVPEEELRVGVGPERPVVLTAIVRGDPPPEASTVVRYDRDDARYVLRMQLSDGRLLTAVAPPFSETITRSPLTPLMDVASADEANPLALIPLVPSDPRGGEPLRWVRTPTAFQGELALEFDNARYHAHYTVPLPDPLLAVARGTLLLALNLGLFFAFWLGGRGLLRDVLPPETRITGLAVTFRTRVTLALFGFFVLANAIFGTLAYRTLAQASTRAAQVLAERVVEDAAGHYLEVGGQMERLARQVGTELLEYREGELREGSVEELVELGLYEGWTPFELNELLDGREGVRARATTALGRWRYETAYRRLPDGDILAAQVPLQAGATAIRTSDLAELLAFAVLLGAALSLALALAVGRALTRPIQALQTASERVGAGDLELRLPAGRRDEFGAVFRAFNRMVGRVRRARRQLLRTTRRTQAIMEEAAVGMVALDPAGRVTLVNPHAERLLGTPFRTGEPMPSAGPLGDALAQWLAAYLAGEEDEGGGELVAEDRRVRVRARRLGSSQMRRGVVVALEDVTDELRTERVLAWGEMARQVAHEVKNPLTPIKLSIQHIRRAWDDERADFDEILVKNADAMLMEIDRLAGIAESFSRFGAPTDGRLEPLAGVDLATLIDEVLALYGGSEAPVHFEREVAEGVARVTARSHELKEVLINLLENAREAVRGEGTVRIGAAPHGADRVWVTVADDGVGIPEEYLPRVFEPRFSTRSRGTGLGLAIVKRLVESWGGTVALHSASGQGTTAELSLRVWEASEV